MRLQIMQAVCMLLGSMVIMTAATDLTVPLKLEIKGKPGTGPLVYAGQVGIFSSPEPKTLTLTAVTNFETEPPPMETFFDADIQCQHGNQLTGVPLVESERQQPQWDIGSSFTCPFAEIDLWTISVSNSDTKSLKFGADLTFTATPSPVGLPLVLDASIPGKQPSGPASAHQVDIPDNFFVDDTAYVSGVWGVVTSPSFQRNSSSFSIQLFCQRDGRTEGTVVAQKLFDGKLEMLSRSFRCPWESATWHVEVVNRASAALQFHGHVYINTEGGGGGGGGTASATSSSPGILVVAVVAVAIVVGMAFCCFLSFVCKRCKAQERRSAGASNVVEDVPLYGAATAYGESDAAYGETGHGAPYGEPGPGVVRYQ